jgi:flagellar biosynthesis/type III secretory pathway M-ring protein FliF/YscJ
VQINIFDYTGNNMASTWSKISQRKKIKYIMIAVAWFAGLALAIWVNLQ